MIWFRLKTYILISGILLLSIAARSQPNYDSYTVSLLTYSPGTELYSSFGHSSVRVRNISGAIDWVYNYGTFDFDDPKFYLNFVSGKLNYHLSRVPYEYVEKETIKEVRSLIETPLNLGLKEKTRILQYLEINYLPENREYKYDFLYSNCATKIVELIDFGTQNRTIYNPMVVPEKSFRELMDSYLSTRPWIDMGIDFLMGLPADRTVQSVDAAFLPDYLHLIVKNARIAGNELSNHTLSKTDIVRVYPQKTSAESKLKPAWILWPLVLILLISSTLGSYLSGFFRIIMTLFSLTVSALGILILLLWLFTSHYIFNYNTDLLWANPIYLLLFLIIKPRNDGSLSRIGKTSYVLLAGLVLLGAFTSFFIEKNGNLTALACIVLIQILDLTRNRKIKTIDPLEIS